MLIRFLGADRTVTGSSHLLEVNGLRILLDCGLYQGARDEAARLNAILPPDPQKIDVVILSHGHLDHCGKLPVLLGAGFRGPIYCTTATNEVARIILNDSAKIQQENAEYLNRRAIDPKAPPIKPLYGPAEIPAVIKACKHVEYGVKTDLGGGVSFTFFDAGHILGSAYVWIEWNESNGATAPPKRLLFTGDIGRYDAPIIEDPVPPPGPADVIITESTYGGVSHGPISEVEPQLLDALQFCISHQSRLLIPSFAIGRTQTMLWYIAKLVAEKKVPPIRTYIDSPMGVAASRVYSQFQTGYDEQTKALLGTSDLIAFSKVILAESGDQSRQINADRGPCVIIASSPTCEFGRILHHLTQSIEDQNDIVLFVGYVPPNTLGRRLQDGTKRVRILDRWYDVRCQIRTTHGLSAHADGAELQRFLQPAINDKTQICIVHGEANQAEALGAALMSAGVRSTMIPAMYTSSVLFGARGVKSPATPASGDGD